MNNLKIAVKVDQLNIFYREKQIVKDLSVNFYENRVTAICGVTSTGKSTLIKSLSRLIELETSVRYQGKIEFFGQNIFNHRTNLNRLRRQIGMIFPTPNIFPMTIYDNVAYGVKLIGWYPKNELNTIVEISLRRVGLWDEVRHRLYKPANDLSFLQQQLLCLARVLALQPKVLILDEPYMSFGMLKKGKLEEIIDCLRQDLTIIIATQNTQFALRVCDYIGYMVADSHVGKLVSFQPTTQSVRNSLDNKMSEQVYKLHTHSK